MDPPIIYMDINKDNIFFAENGVLKLGNLATSNYLNENDLLSTYCGTGNYLPPERIMGLNYDERVDIWSIRIVMFQLLTGSYPYASKDFELIDNILRSNINWPKEINMDAKDLILKILKIVPQDRIFLVDMLKHPFFIKFIEKSDEFLIKPHELES